MLIGYCGSNHELEVMYYRNHLWVRGTHVTINHAGTRREAIERARRNLRNFVALDD